MSVRDSPRRHGANPSLQQAVPYVDEVHDPQEWFCHIRVHFGGSQVRGRCRSWSRAPRAVVVVPPPGSTDSNWLPAARPSRCVWPSRCSSSRSRSRRRRRGSKRSAPRRCPDLAPVVLSVAVGSTAPQFKRPHGAQSSHESVRAAAWRTKAWPGAHEAPVGLAQDLASWSSPRGAAPCSQPYLRVN
jgi:hypothetical protein